MPNKFYESQSWLYLKIVKEKLTPEQVGAICGVSHMTIRRWMERHKIK